MQGRDDPQRDLWDVESVAGHLLPAGSVFAFLAEHRGRLFPDAFFEDLFASGRGRPSLPASTVASVIVLQTLHNLSDRETVEALTFDLRWKAACGIALDAPAFHPSTLTYWRRRLAASQRPARIFDDVAEVVAATGAVKGKSRRALDSTVLDDAVARQEPRLSWAAGLRDDGTTTLLVTDLAGGWIPPHVRLPAQVTLLEPTTRRQDANVVDLLGAITVAAAHHANTYVGEPGPDEPALSGDRPARSAAPQVDELGPTLVDAVRRRDGLPRIAQAVAAPAVRKTGVLENETEMLRECAAAIQHSVLAAYPNHDLAVVGDWMLLAAIEALIDGHEYLANYHLSWFGAISHRGGS